MTTASMYPPRRDARLTAPQRATIVLHDWSWIAALTDPLAWREATARPWMLRYDRRVVTVATDGHALLLVESDLGEHRAPREIAEQLRRSIRDPGRTGALVMAPAMCYETTIEELCRFCDIPAPTTAPVCRACHDEGAATCSECNGDGVIGSDYGTPCSRCAGEGAVPCRQCHVDHRAVHPVRIGVNTFNRHLLARFLGRLPMEGAVLWLDGGPQLPALLLGTGWRVIVMPLRHEARWATAPSFDEWRTAQLTGPARAILG